MIRSLGALALAIGLAAAQPALAQAPKAGPADPALPPAASLLTWTPDQQLVGYRSIEKIYAVGVAPRGKQVRGLPLAERQIDPAWNHDGVDYDLARYMEAYNVTGVLVLKDGEIVLERYAHGRGPQDRWTSFSVAKSVTSTLVGAALADGAIKSLDDVISTYIPDLKGSAYDAVTVRQLITMTSGVKWNEDYTDPNSDVARAGFAALEPGVNPLVSYMRRLPRAHPPGTVFNYNTGETDLAGVLVSSAVGKPLSAYLSEKIWAPYGMEADAIWIYDLGGHERGGCCMSMTLRDYARFGLFIAEGGKAGGRAVVPEGWTQTATSKVVATGFPGTDYGYFWWRRPNGAYEAVGIFGQAITTFEDEGLIIAVNSAWPRATGQDLSAARNAMYEAVRRAVKE